MGGQERERGAQRGWTSVRVVYILTVRSNSHLVQPSSLLFKGRRSLDQNGAGAHWPVAPAIQFSRRRGARRLSSWLAFEVTEGAGARVCSTIGGRRRSERHSSSRLQTRSTFTQISPECSHSTWLNPPLALKPSAGTCNMPRGRV